MDKMFARNLGLFIGGITMGSLLGHQLAKKKYQAIADEEIASVKARYALLNKDEYPTPMELLDEIRTGAEVIELKHPRESYTSDVPDEMSVEEFKALGVEVEEVPVATEADTSVYNVFAGSFANAGVSEVKDQPMPDVDMDNPYIVSVDEHMEDFQTYEKISLAYWEDDDTLSDDRDTIVPDIEGTVGAANLTKFGLGSKDINIVYVRNHHLETDFEIVRDPRSFSEVIMGFKSQSSKAPQLRMKESDDK